MISEMKTLILNSIAKASTAKDHVEIVDHRSKENVTPTEKQRNTIDSVAALI
jgi:hypothetical protein